MLSKEEIAGVMAHELAHIKHRDTLIMSIAATIGGAISMVAQYLQFGMMFGGNRDDRGGGLGVVGALIAMLVAPFAAMLVQMAISRSREYAADHMGALICGNPRWLASALARIHNGVHDVPNEDAERVPAAAHLFIINPLTAGGIDNLFSTHPNTENRSPHSRPWLRKWAAAPATRSKALQPLVRAAPAVVGRVRGLFGSALWSLGLTGCR